MNIQIAGFLDNSLVNGKGIRSVVFVSGCKHNCPGCHNKAMQDFEYGDNVKITQIFSRIKDNLPIIRGVTFSGGEPFEQAAPLAALAEMIEKEGLDIWCYTGYTFEQLSSSDDKNKLRLLRKIDVLVDGKFEKDNREGALKYTGSKNQRIIDVKKTFKQLGIDTTQINKNRKVEFKKEHQ